MAKTDLSTVGGTIQKLRNERGIKSAQELSRLLYQYGVRASRSFIASIESGALLPSKNFLRGCERVFDLPRGDLLRYAALHHAEQWAERADMSISEYLDLVEAGIKSVGPAPAGNAETGGGAVPGDPHDAGPHKPPHEKNRLIRDSSVKHRVANWWSRQIFFGLLMPVCA